MQVLLELGLMPLIRKVRFVFLLPQINVCHAANNGVRKEKTLAFLTAVYSLYLINYIDQLLTSHEYVC